MDMREHSRKNKGMTRKRLTKYQIEVINRARR
jgi:hypothetical protein